MTQRVKIGLALAALATLAACQCDALQDADSDAGAAREDDASAEDDMLREQEPNNTPGQATRFVVVASAPGSPLLRPMRGELSEPGDVDWYRLPAEAKALMRRVEVRPDGPEGDLVLLWASPDATQNLAGPGEPEVIPNLGLGELLLGVKASGAGVSGLRYSLQLTNLPSLATPELELASEEPINAQAPGDLQGLINFAGDVDVLKVSVAGLKDRRIFGVEVRGPGVIVEIGPWDAPPLITLQQKGDEIASVPNLLLPDGAEHLRVAVRALDATAAQPGAWTVRIIPHPAVPEGTTLEVEAGAAGAAQPVPQGSLVRGYLHEPADRDAFTWSLPPLDAPGAVYVLSATLEAQGEDLALRYTLPGNDMAVEIAAAGEGAGELLCNRTFGPGNVTLEVERQRAEDGTPLVLGPGRYSLAVLLDTTTGAEVEPNNTPAQATPIPTSGAAARGWLSTAEDVDLFALQVTPAAPVPPPAAPTSAPPAPKGGGLSRALDRLVREDTPTPAAPEADPDAPAHVELEITSRGLRLEAELLDTDGIALVTRRQQIAGDPLKLVADVPPGRYIVRIRDAGSDRKACDGGYTILWSPSL